MENASHEKTTVTELLLYIYVVAYLFTVVLCLVQQVIYEDVICSYIFYIHVSG